MSLGKSVASGDKRDSIEYIEINEINDFKEAAMEAVLSTKLTKGGQTTLPVSIRRMLGIEDEGRVYWVMEGDRAYVSATPSAPPLTIASAEEFWERIAVAEEQVAAGKTRDAREVLDSVKAEYGL